MDAPHIGEKSRLLMEILREVKKTKPSAIKDEYVALFNAFSIPRGYLYVDPDGLCHIVRIDSGLLDKRGLRPGNLTMVGSEGSLGVNHLADVIWKFEAATGIWTVIKDRAGDFERLCPIKCGGIPASRRTSIGR